MEKSLGAGYDTGYWSWNQVTGRPDQCQFDSQKLQEQRRIMDQLRQGRYSSREQMCSHITDSGYHSGSRIRILLAF